MYTNIMNERPRQSPLPLVTIEDICCELYEDVTDPTHRERWKRIQESNPLLLQEIHNRAAKSASASYDHPLEVTRVIVDNVTFALSALEAALARTQREQDDRHHNPDEA